MKAPDFGYVRPDTLQDALALLADDADALAIAGGQSLLAGLNMRLSAPSALVDVSRLSELKGIEASGDGVRVGAGTRHVELMRSPLVQERLPLLIEALHNVAHAAIRNRGTIGGSFAHFDPAAELPACAIALDATVVLADAGGRREVPARTFFRGLFETDRRAGELIVEVRFRARPPDERWAFLELSRRRGDFAQVALAALARVEGAAEEAAVVEADFVYFGASQPPTRSRRVGEALRGRRLVDAGGNWIAEALVADLDDTDASGLRADTKIKLAVALTRRALRRLATGAGEAVPT